MRCRFNISMILRFMALLLFVFMLNACGTDRQMRKIAQDPETEKNATWEMMDDPKCWQGDIVNEIYSIAGKIAMNMYEKLTEGAMALMMIAFGVWLTFRLMKHISSFTEESPAEFWTEIIQKLFICTVCGLLASSTTGALFVLNSIIFPLYNAILELGGTMISHISQGSVDVFGKTWNVPFQVEKAKYSLVCQAGKLTKATLENGFPLEPQKMMECLTCAISERLNFGMRLGLQAMIKMPLTGIVVGLLLVIIFIFVKLCFVFYLVDAVFRFALMLMILPLLIMAYAFKTTRNWVKIGFFTILNSAGILAMIAIIIVMILVGMHQLIKAYSPWMMIGLAADNVGQEGGLDDLGVPFLVLLMMAFLTVGAIKIAKHTADTLIGGGGEANFQKKIASRGAQLAKFALFSFAGKAVTALGGKKDNMFTKLGHNSGGSTDDDAAPEDDK